MQQIKIEKFVKKTDVQNHSPHEFPRAIEEQQRVAKSKSKERRVKVQVSVINDISVGVLKLIETKVGGAKENFANALNRVER